VHVVMVRHAHPVIERDAPSGVADPGLSELGEWQAARVTDWLRHEPIDHVVTSSKRRAIATAQALIEHHGVDHDAIGELDEVDRFSATYLPTEVLLSEGGEYLQAIREGRFADIGWDDPDTFRSRVVAAWETIVATRPGQRVLVVSHGGVMNRIFSHVLGVEGRQSYNVPYASISRMEVADDGRVRIVSMNETGHFDASREARRGPMGDGTDYLGLG
jgi:2,3-bisphosphoglycerate-dependent phosphoglycerate mutase